MRVDDFSARCAVDGTMLATLSYLRDLCRIYFECIVTSLRNDENSVNSFLFGSF